MPREPYNRVANSLRRIQQRLDTRKGSAARIGSHLDADAQTRDLYLDLFGLAHQYGALNGGELNTLRTIIQTWQDATTAERLAATMVVAELAGKPLTHVRHSILGLQARSNRLAKVGACN